MSALTEVLEVWRQTPGPPPHTGPGGDLIQAHDAFIKLYLGKQKLYFLETKRII